MGKQWSSEKSTCNLLLFCCLYVTVCSYCLNLRCIFQLNCSIVAAKNLHQRYKSFCVRVCVRAPLCNKMNDLGEMKRIKKKRKIVYLSQNDIYLNLGFGRMISRALPLRQTAMFETAVRDFFLNPFEPMHFNSNTMGNVQEFYFKRNSNAFQWWCSFYHFQYLIFLFLLTHTCQLRCKTVVKRYWPFAFLFSALLASFFS